MRNTLELVEAAKAGESEAIAELVERYQRAAITTAWSITRDFHEAQDISQESFVIAFRQLGSLKANEAFGQWLLIIVRRAALHAIKNKFPKVDESFSSDVADVQPRWLSEFADILPLIDQLPSHEQEVIRLRYLSDLAIEEIASITGRPLGTVTKQISRAVARLRSLVSKVAS
ncbi:MAG: sigma-70 family RNA polymerase sigma factor [Planctomycetales bacterium]|nr:sigma-70 family RNA polymerase sigma factor [Planctomycetales bacterium]